MPLEPGTVCESGKHEHRESRTGDQQSHDSPEHPLEPTSAPNEQISIRDATKILKSSSNVPRLAAVSHWVLSMRAEASAIDLLLEPVHRWVWADVDRRARKLMRFSETEADGAHDLMRAAERTPDKALRLLYLRHAD